MHSLIIIGHEPSYVMLRKTTSEEYVEVLGMAQLCCSRFQRLSLWKFLLQGRIGYGNFIQCSGNVLNSLEECWPNTGGDGLMKLSALSRLLPRCFGFWFWSSFMKQGCGRLEHKTDGIFWLFYLDASRAPLACHGWSRLHGIWRGSSARGAKRTGCTASWSIKATGRAIVVRVNWIGENQEVMLFAHGNFLCRRWILVRWILRAQRFGSNVVWNGLSRAGGAHKKLRVVESEVGEDQKMFSDGS